MNLDEYFEEAATLSTVTARTLLAIVNPFTAVALTYQGWIGLLAAVFPTVNDARFEAGNLARSFYDSERLKHVGSTKDAWISTLDPDDFQDEMAEYRVDMSRGDTTDGMVAEFIGGMLRTVDNGARLTQIQAAYDDPECSWARVEGGDDGSCAFCTALISRGPIYESADTAGGSYAFHRYCNCRVVCVFDPSNWPGREQYLEAERLYAEAARQEGKTMSNLRKMTR